MESTISAAEANRQFSKLLGEVRGGATVIITSHSRPVAIMSPITRRERAATMAKQILIDRLQAQPLSAAVSWNRDELYEK
jgi:prevent-host-death family protein